MIEQRIIEFQADPVKKKNPFEDLQFECMREHLDDDTPPLLELKRVSKEEMI